MSESRGARRRSRREISGAIARAAAAMLATAALVGGGALAAQEPTPAERVSAPASVVFDSPDWARQTEVVTRPGAPVVAIAVALPVGSAEDPAGSGGAGWILADAVARGVMDRVGPGRVEGAARVEPDHTTFTFLARTEAVSEVLDAFRLAAFEMGPGRAAIAAARDARISELVFQQDSPVLDVNRASRGLIFGTGEARVHAPGGTLATVETLGDETLGEQRRRTYRPGEAVVVVVGPVTKPEPPAAPADTLADAPRPGASVLDGPRTLTGRVPAPSPGLPWTVGSREAVERQVTNSWITVAWPVPAELPRVAVEFVAHRMHRELNPSPPDPGVFSATVEVLGVPGGEVLVVRAAVQPRQAGTMENRILSLPDQLSTPLDDIFFLWYRRQFRAERLLADAPPEASARRRAREILDRGSALDVSREIWALTPEMVAETASALGEPRVLAFGPPGSPE